MLNCIRAPMDTLVKAILIPDEFIRSKAITSSAKWIHNDGKSEIKCYQKIILSTLSVHYVQGNDTGMPVWTTNVTHKNESCVMKIFYMILEKQRIIKNSRNRRNPF